MILGDGVKFNQKGGIIRGDLGKMPNFNIMKERKLVVIIRSLIKATQILELTNLIPSIFTTFETQID